MRITQDTGRARNRRGEGGRLRSQLVEAAGELLDGTGDRGAVTLRALARHVGIAATSIYAHFDGPEAVLQALVEETFAELARTLAAATTGSADPVERLHAASEAYVAFGVARPHRYTLLFGDAALLAEPEGKDIGTMVGAEAFRLLLDLVRDCIAAGRSAGTDPMTDAVAVWTGLHGHVGLRAALPDFPWPAAAGVELLVTRLARLG